MLFRKMTTTLKSAPLKILKSESPNVIPHFGKSNTLHTSLDFQGEWKHVQSQQCQSLSLKLKCVQNCSKIDKGISRNLKLTTLRLQNYFTIRAIVQVPIYKLPFYKPNHVKNHFKNFYYNGNYRSLFVPNIDMHIF